LFSAIIFIVFLQIMVVTINMLNIPHGISGKELPLNRGQPDISLTDPATLQVSEMNQGVGNMNLETFEADDRAY